MYDAIGYTPTGTLAIFAAHGLDSLITELLSRNADEEQHGQSFSDALLAASYSGQTDTVHLLLSTGKPDIEAISKASLASVHSGNSDIFSALDDKASDLSLDPYQYPTILYHAACLRRHNIVKRILESVPEKCGDEETRGMLLHYAVKGGDMKTVQSVLEIFAENTEPTLVIQGIFGAVIYGHIDLALYLIESLLSLQTQSTNVQNANRGPDQQNLTTEGSIQDLLKESIRSDQVQLLTRLLDVLTRHNRNDINPEALIEQTVKGGKDACFKALLDIFVKTGDETTSQGDIPIDNELIASTTILYGTKFMIEELLKCGFSLDRQEYGTRLSEVVSLGSDSKNSDHDLLKFLVEQGQRRVTQELYCDSVTYRLADAVSNNNPSMVRILVQGNPDLKKKTVVRISDSTILRSLLWLRGCCSSPYGSTC